MGKTLFKLTEEDKETLIALYNQGLMDTQIAQLLSVSRSAIYYWRKKLNMQTTFDYSKIRKFDNQKFEELFNQGLSDYKIGKLLNVSPDTIYGHRMRHGYFRENYRLNKEIPLTDFQKQVLIGTLLGDSSLRKPNMNPSFSCAHGAKQKDYSEHLAKIFDSLGAKCCYHKRNIKDKRNGILYEDYTVSIPTNPSFLKYYNAFYSTGKKVIPIDLLKEEFTEVSLAYMFMDDGTKTRSSYKIATNCFAKENVEEFQELLKNKWGIETSIHHDNGLYIMTKSAALFKYLISPYICDCLKYKL